MSASSRRQTKPRRNAIQTRRSSLKSRRDALNARHKPAKSRPRKRKVELGITDQDMSSVAGVVLMHKMADFYSLDRRIRRFVHVKLRDWHSTDVENVRLLMTLFATGSSTLSDVDALGADDAIRAAAGFGPNVVDARRVGEWLRKFDDDSIEGLHEVLRGVAREVAPAVIADAVKERGRVMVFIDNTDIEVSSGKFEGAKKGYQGKWHLNLHLEYLEGLQVGHRLNPGDVHDSHGWDDLLDNDVAPLIPDGTPVWALFDNAYYSHKVASRCDALRCDYSMSVTNPNYRKPVLSKAKELPPEAWQDLGNGEWAAIVKHWPANWPREQSYLVVRHDCDGSQQRLFWRHTVILVSRDDLPLDEMLRLHRGKQGHENMHKGLLSGLGGHIPACHDLTANRAFYAIAQLTQMLLVAVQHKLLPKSARKHGIRKLVRELMRTAGRLTSSGGKLCLNFAACSFRIEWIRHALERLKQMERKAMLGLLDMLAPS